MFIPGPVARNKATASGRLTPEAATGTPRRSEDLSMAGRLASDDWVLKPTAWAGATSRAKRRSGSRAPAIATQLIQLPVAWSFRGGETTWFATLLGAVSLVVVVCLLLPSSTAIFTAEQDPPGT